MKKSRVMKWFYYNLIRFKINSKKCYIRIVYFDYLEIESIFLYDV